MLDSHKLPRICWHMTDQNNMTETQNEGISLSRRKALRLGAVGAVAVVSIRPALAQAAVSVLNCEIPMPNSGQNIDAEGMLVPTETPGSFEVHGQIFKGEEVKAAMSGSNLPGTSYDQSDAYVRYIRRLQNGQSGFTCYASIQAPR